MKRKILSLVLCMALFSAALCTGVQAAGMDEFQKQRTYDGRFSDISGKWHETYIADLYEYGLAEGVSDTEMAPDEPVTVAQIIALAARINAKYYNGKIGESGDEWYQPYVSYAIDYGLITEDDTENVNRPATRGESVLIFSRALPRQQLEGMNQNVNFSDIGAADPCRDAALMLCRAGVLSGYEDGSFRPDQGISRAEAMTVADRMVNKPMRQGFNEWWQSRPVNESPSTEVIGVGIGHGRATFLAQGVSMLTIDLENSSFALAVYADLTTGGMVTMTGACEVKQDTNGNVILSCVVTDRVAQGGASTEAAKQAAAVEALGFVYNANGSATLAEAIVNRTLKTDADTSVVGLLKIGMTMAAAN